MDRLEHKEYFTVTQVVEITGLSNKNICYRQRKLGIKPRIEGHKAYYTAEQIEKIQSMSDNSSSLNLEELKKQHPLVKDDRFFKLTYFPDVIPSCFEGLKNA